MGRATFGMRIIFRTRKRQGGRKGEGKRGRDT